MRQNWRRALHLLSSRLGSAWLITRDNRCVLFGWRYVVQYFLLTGTWACLGCLWMIKIFSLSNCIWRFSAHNNNVFLSHCVIQNSGSICGTIFRWHPFIGNWANKCIYVFKPTARKKIFYRNIGRQNYALYFSVPDYIAGIAIFLYDVSNIWNRTK